MKKIINAYIRFMQRILITILLTVVYVVFFGITKLFLALFMPRTLWRRKNKNEDSFWLKMKEEPVDMEHALQQS